MSLLKIDVAAFACADVVVAPCPEALECYRTASAEIDGLLNSKSLRFVPTGLVDPRVGSDARPGGTSDGVNIAYVGRHTAVKGYDLLTAAIPPLLDPLNATMNVAGVQAPLPAPVHPRWRESGWIQNPMGLLDQADFFILPNRQTYFDIVALEVMASGVALLASATGGNKYLASTSPGIRLFRPDADCLSAAIRNLAAGGSERLRAMGVENRRSFERCYTSRHFATGYRAVVADELAPGTAS